MGRCNSKDVEIFDSAFDRFLHFSREDGDSPPTPPRKAPQRCNVCHKRIALVFQVEFEPFGWKYGCASRRAAIPSCKRQSGVLQQEYPAGPPLDVTGNPEAFLVAADEKCRDRLADEAGIKRRELRRCDCGLVGRQNTGAPAMTIDRSCRTFRRLPRRMIWACQLHGDRCGLIDGDDLPWNCRGRICSATAAASRMRGLTNALVLAAMAASSRIRRASCRRCHRNASWIGVASHKRAIKKLSDLTRKHLSAALTSGVFLITGSAVRRARNRPLAIKKPRAMPGL
jgi:hypothetical protein